MIVEQFGCDESCHYHYKIRACKFYVINPISYIDYVRMRLFHEISFHGIISLNFITCNFDAFASEFQENLDCMFLQHYIHNDISSHWR